MKASSTAFAFGTAAFFTCAAAVVGYAVGAFALLTLGLPVDPGVIAAYSATGVNALFATAAASVAMRPTDIERLKPAPSTIRTVTAYSALLATIALLSLAVPSIGLTASIYMAGAAMLTSVAAAFVADKRIEASKHPQPMQVQALQA